MNPVCRLGRDACVCSEPLAWGLEGGVTSFGLACSVHGVRALGLHLPLIFCVPHLCGGLGSSQ